ncbi:MAG: HTH domain-containing protein [Alphaproteobacteria bacterium]|nr:HTH domain-containing protein [Alphaproteobacteria bacterium]
MRRADRLFEIIQMLRTAHGPLTAAAIGEALEVTPRTIYRDIAVLQAMRVPIEGAAGDRLPVARGLRPATAQFHGRGDRGDCRGTQPAGAHGRRQPDARGGDRGWQDRRRHPRPRRAAGGGWIACIGLGRGDAGCGRSGHAAVGDSECVQTAPAL